MKKSEGNTFIIYVLISQKDGNLYIGCTSDLDKRLKYHNSGNVRSTKGRKPLKLIYKEYYKDKFEAYRKERYYKTPKGKKDLKDKIKRSGIV